MYILWVDISSKGLDLPSMELKDRLVQKEHIRGTAHCLDSQPKRQVWGGIQGTTKVPGAFKGN